MTTQPTTQTLEELRAIERAIIDKLKVAQAHNPVTGYYSDVWTVVTLREELQPVRLAIKALVAA